MKENVSKVVYQRNTEGELILVSSETIEVDLPTNEDKIKEKEEQLLSIYEEIQKLKGE